MKVYAKDDEIKRLIKHPNGKGFKDDGSADWPDDQFTKRRVRDGDVTVDPPEPPPEGGAQRGKPEGKPGEKPVGKQETDKPSSLQQAPNPGSAQSQHTGPGPTPGAAVAHAEAVQAAPHAPQKA